jgi:hypothetical protein
VQDCFFFSKKKGVNEHEKGAISFSSLFSRSANPTAFDVPPIKRIFSAILDRMCGAHR